ncbi:MAG: glycosyltransferase family 4 protein [Myxococcales bacterium]
MRILFLLDTLGGGGAERSLQELLPVFVRRGVEPIVACFHHRKEGVEKLVSGQYELRFLGNGGRASQVRAVRALLQTERIDLMHTTLFEADVFGRAATLGSSVPVVTSLVNMPYESARLTHDRNVNRAKLLVARSLEIATGRLFADHFHAISHAVKEAAAEKLFIPEQRITVVHRGRDPARLGRRTDARRRNARMALGISEDDVVVLNAARQEFQKGQRFLLEAFARLPLPRVRLLIAGRAGSATSELQRLARPLAERVLFLEHRDDLPELMAAADIFALPSLWEGLGGVLLEAMALELPIVASDLAPVREITGPADAARLVPPGDASALADALSEMLRNPQQEAARAERARKLFDERYTIDRSGDALFELFEKTARRRRSNRGQA